MFVLALIFSLALGQVPQKDVDTFPDVHDSHWAFAIKPSGPRGPTMTGYPAYAHVLGLTIGTCTTAQLVRRLGRGVVQTGGHSDSGHSWTFRKAQLDTDGFNFVGDSRSPLIDQVVLSWSGELGKVREFKRFGMGILGKLRSGMSNAQVSAALAPLKLRSVSYGNLGITENRIIRIWKHRYNCLYVLFLEFERGGLNGMEMFADVDTDSNILKS